MTVFRQTYLRFIVIGIPRSGTSVSYNSILEHTEVSGVNDEVITRYFFESPLSKFTFGNNLQIEEERSYQKLFDAICSLNTNGKTKAIGMKVTIATPRDATILVAALKKRLPSVKVIWVKRENLIALFGSFIRAQKTKIHHSIQQTKLSSNTNSRVKIPKAKFIKFLLDEFEINKELEKLKETHNLLEFFYEKDVMAGNYEKIIEFLDLNKEGPIDSALKKVAPNPERYISNYKKTEKVMRNVYTYIEKNNDYKKYERIRRRVNKIKRFRKKVKRLIKE